MPGIELLIVATTPALQASLGRYAGLEVISVPTLDIALRLINNERAPHVVYLEDTGGNVWTLWSAVLAARAKGIPVYVGLQRAGKLGYDDFVAAGVDVIVPADGADDLDSATVAAWLARHVNARERAAASGQALIAIGSAKGGVGKSLVSALFSEVFVRLGLRVLVVDCDLSNTGLASIFRFRSGLRSYTELASKGDAAWTPEAISELIYPDHPSGVHFLVGSDDAADPRDLYTPQWEAMLQAIRSLPQYDVVVLDTSPEVRKRPYIVIAARDGGAVIMPTPPGRKERDGAAKALRVLQAHEPDLTDRCYLLMMAPETGVDVSVEKVSEQFLAAYPRVRILGQLPRAARLIARADEPDQYVCPFDIAPHSRFTRAVYTMAERLCEQLAITAPRQLPRSSLWQRLRGERLRSDAAGPRVSDGARLADAQREVRA